MYRRFVLPRYLCRGMQRAFTSFDSGRKKRSLPAPARPSRLIIGGLANDCVVQSGGRSGCLASFWVYP